MKRDFLRIVLAAGWLVTLSLPAAQAQNSDTATERLRCPERPNCVNSRVDRDLPPLQHSGPPDSAIRRLKATLAGFPEATIEQETASALEVIFTTSLGFRDQVIFVVDEDGKQIDFRSRSLIGYYDFGKNRSRMRAFSSAFARTPDAKAPR